MLAETGIPGDGKKGILYLTLRCHHQNDFCIKTGSDESRVYVSLILRVNSQDDVYQSQADVFLICLCVCMSHLCVCVCVCVRACVRACFVLSRERKAEWDSNRGPSSYQPNALPLGRAGSLQQRTDNVDVFIVVFQVF